MTTSSRNCQTKGAIAVDLPSVGGPTDQAAATMADDAVAVQQVVSKLADQGRDIVLVSHSYGGIPATEGAHGLSRKDREASGKKGGITGLVYVTALLVGPGQSLGDVMGSAIPDYVQVNVSPMLIFPIC
jgi:pimeloyl-ACP methyl ester carboxylesterase